MILSKFLFSFGLLAACTLPGHGQADCDGCEGSSCVKLNDNVYGCYGTFSSGTISDAANALCGDGFHICSSANEAGVLGLTAHMCGNLVPQDHSFWSLESSGGDGYCYSEYGRVVDDRPSEDVWGCAGAGTDIAACDGATNPAIDPACGPLNMACGDADYDYSGYGFGFCPTTSGDSCEGIELFVMSVTDASKSGSLCCTDDVGYDPSGTNCDETITVRSIREGDDVSKDFSPYVGTYSFYGYDASGNPRYVHQASGAEFGVTSYLGYTHLVGFTIPDYHGFWNIEDGTLTAGANAGMYTLSGELFNGDEVTFYRLGDPIQMRAVINDCEWYGFETQSQSEQVCPSFDHTSNNADCSADANCETCQSWGCTKCHDGFYKMALNTNCQSCTGNYPGCSACADYDGCTACGAGYTFAWEQDCGDWVCVAN